MLAARGGILGRKLVPVFHDDDVAEQDVSVRSQSACTTWTEDNAVAAVANAVAAIVSDVTLDCLQKRDTPMLTSVLAAPWDDVTHAHYAPLLITPGLASYSRIIPVS